MQNPNVLAFPFDSVKAVSEEEVCKEEIEKVYQEIWDAYQTGKHIVIYSTGEASDIERAREAGRLRGMNPTMVSNQIVHALGELTGRLLEQDLFEGIVMTGGDTAKQICKNLSIKGFELLDELETGIPLGRFSGYKDILTVTKAGGFGTEDVFMNSILTLKGEND